MRSALEDPYEQGQALGKLLGGVLPTGAVAGGVVGKAFSKVGRWAKRVQGSKVKGYTDATFQAFQKQLQQHGRESLLKSRTTLQRRLLEHSKKLDEIRNFESQLKALDALLKN